MKDLKTFILEASILADIDDQLESSDEALKKHILEFINNNYDIRGKLIISDEPNKDGKYEVSLDGDVLLKKFNDTTSLTNNMFIWHKIKGDFYCRSLSSNLKSLEGAPKEVKGDFNCGECKSLTSLKGAPEEVGGEFICTTCKSLKSLEGAPQKVGSFRCSGCTSLKTLKGAPEEVGDGFYCSKCDSLESLKGAPQKVGGNFWCNECKSLKSLEGAPKNVGGGFSCEDCGTQFTKDDINKVSNVKGQIRC